MKQKVGDRCKKCGGIIGENIEGKPICACEVWPGNEQEKGFTKNGRHYLFTRIPIKQRLWWTSKQSTELWYENKPGECDSMYFPYATQFMKSCPWLAVRVFWMMLQIKGAWLDLCKIYPKIIL